ncbi:hypothetical protein GIB67_037871 [Kingdonia uniflora]|uniref:Protein kinase domain-containing protein n=1 Tax=Kingdonia uniflora TaxID=39325 RepID=A0A7J7LGZ7_9MAGN|nr:hypothetical protein GIB67_037871 [Kingdonia uniflora]
MENKGCVLMQRYELGRLLGQGTFAKVYKEQNLKSGESVVVKVIGKEKVLKVGLIEQIKWEISIMRLVRHRHVLQLYEVMATKTKIYFVMKYAKGGELFNKVAKGRLKEDVARRYFQQLISAVNFCHSRGVYYQDLKPENLLLDENSDLKVFNFELSALAESKRQDGLLHTPCRTPTYVAPEVINRKGYDGAKANIWSCGVIIFVLFAGYLPFHNSNLMKMYQKIGVGFDGGGAVWVVAMAAVLWLSCSVIQVACLRDAIIEALGCLLGLILLEHCIRLIFGCGRSRSAYESFGVVPGWSLGFDLSGLFEEENKEKREARFTSR